MLKCFTSDSLSYACRGITAVRRERVHNEVCVQTRCPRRDTKIRCQVNPFDLAIIKDQALNRGTCLIDGIREGTMLVQEIRTRPVWNQNVGKQHASIADCVDGQGASVPAREHKLTSPSSQTLPITYLTLLGQTG